MPATTVYQPTSGAPAPTSSSEAVPVPPANFDDGANPPSPPPAVETVPASLTNNGNTAVSQVATRLDSSYQGLSVVVLKVAFVALLGLALCVAATGIIIAVALGLNGFSSRPQH
ncbi:MAG TPA: hypothetical protein VHU80_14720 [Polyangiaceae bacterium]|nr:hypothetical protein [Polyangiaceae bacterium]